VVDFKDFKGAFKKKGDRYFLDIEVKPGSSKRGLTEFDAWRKRFVVYVKSQATKGRANKEVTEVISEALGVKNVLIESGHSSRSKTVSFSMETNVEEVCERLRSFLP
jgi:uncharacterized protein (TIGR00251 family)